MKDVAERAGVSVMTVSLVLRGNAPSSRISPETQQRVLEAAKHFRYQPNARGRALRSGYTNILGLYAGYGYVNVRLPFFTEIVSGLQEGCEQFKKDLLLHGIFHGHTTEDIYTELVDGRIDGLVVNMPSDEPLAERLAESHFPVVAVADPLPNIPSITVDDAAGSRMLAEYLQQRGYRRFIYLSSWVRPISTIRRRNAFLDIAAAMHLEVEEVGPPGPLGPEASFMQDILSGTSWQRPTAIVCWNDTAAYDLLAYCRKNQIRVPEDIAIVGFDGCSTPHDSVWSLTTVRAPWTEAARTAVQYLNALLEGTSVPLETVLPVEFVQGQTA
jgi:DNA-binding LacI/PurR family transcriptional regulator